MPSRVESIDELGSIGVVSDQSPASLALNAWTNANNVQFIDQGLRKHRGYDFKLGTPSVAPYTLMSFYDGAKFLWGYAGLNKIWVTDEAAAAHQEITRLSGDYNANTINRWHTGIISQQPFWYNGVDDPQVWNPPTQVTRLVDMPNWPANTTCGTLRSWKSFLIMLDVTQSSVRSPSMFKWSNAAPDESTLPQDWDVNDPTSLAGEAVLAQEQGEGRGLSVNPILDGLPLGDQFIIYRAQSVWGAQFVPGNTRVFRFYKLYDVGLAARNCATAFERRHFMVTPNADAMIHDGVSRPVSIVDNRVRRALSQRMSTTGLTKIFTLTNDRDKEIWICLPDENSSYCNTAWCWSWINNTWDKRDLDDVQDIKLGGFDSSGRTINDLNFPINAWNELINADLYAASQQIWVQAQPGGPRLLTESINHDWAGTPYRSFAERRYAPVGGDESMKTTTKVRVIGEGSATPDFYIGATKGPADPIRWKGPIKFHIGKGKWMPANVTGKYVSFRIEDSSNVAWRATRLDFMQTLRGRR